MEISRLSKMLGIALAATLGLLAHARAGNVCFDAASFREITEPMRLVDLSEEKADTPVDEDKDPSNWRYVEVPRNEATENEDYAKKASASYTFTVPADGEYVLWARVKWHDECSNSFRMSLNGNPPFVLGRNRTFRQWHWVRSPARLDQLQLSEGENTLQLLFRETGPKIDQIFLTGDRRYVPFGIEPETEKAQAEE